MKEYAEIVKKNIEILKLNKSSQLCSDKKPVKWCTYNDNIKIPEATPINIVLSPEEVKDIAAMYYCDTDLSGLFPDMEYYNTLKIPAKFFKVKDAKVSKDRTIIFWEDGTKTVIKKAGLEKNFDLEKAIMAAFTRRALSFGHTAKERSVEKTINNIASMITDHINYEEAKKNKIKKKKDTNSQEDHEGGNNNA